MVGTLFGTTLRHAPRPALCIAMGLAACGAHVDRTPRANPGPESGSTVLTDASLPDDARPSVEDDSGHPADEVTSMNAGASWDARSSAPLDGTNTPTDAGAYDVSVPSVGCTVSSVNAPIDAGGCAFPPSRCVDDVTLAFFANTGCVAGECRWDVLYVRCPNRCFTDRCSFPTTTAP